MKKKHSATATITAGIIACCTLGLSDQTTQSPFDYGLPAQKMVPVQALAMEADTGFVTGTRGSIYAIAVQPDGKILLGGGFVAYGMARPGPGIARSIVRLNSDGSIDTNFFAQVDLLVFSLAVQPDGKVLLGGSFSRVNGQRRTSICRLHPDGSLDEDFKPRLEHRHSTDRPFIATIALQPDGGIVIGGEFTHVGALPRKNLARLHADGSVDADFNGAATGGAAPVALALATERGGTILVGGKFHRLSGVACTNFGRLTANGTAVRLFRPSPDGIVSGITLQPDGRILAHGGFSKISGAHRRFLARLNADGSPDVGFTPLIGTRGLPPTGRYDWSPGIYTMALQADGGVFIGGRFNAVDGQPRLHLARLQPNGRLDTSFDAPIKGRPLRISYPLLTRTIWPHVNSIALQQDGKILVGGFYNSIGGLVQTNIGRLLNNVPAIDWLSVEIETGNVQWRRGGSAPVVLQPWFEYSVDGASVLPVPEINGVPNVLTLTNASWIRARGQTGGGGWHRSSGIIETVLPIGQ